MSNKKEEVKKTGGLQGITAGDSAISTVGLADLGLMYRGYNINELSEHSNFEEVVYLLIKGELPSQAQYNEFTRKLWSNRELPIQLKKVLELLPKEAHPMDIMRTICSIIGVIEPEQDNRSDQEEKLLRLISVFGPALLYWYHFSNSGIRIQTQTSEKDSIAKNFMKLLSLKEEVPELMVKTVDIS